MSCVYRYKNGCKRGHICTRNSVKGRSLCFQHYKQLTQPHGRDQKFKLRREQARYQMLQYVMHNRKNIWKIDPDEKYWWANLTACFTIKQIDDYMNEFK